MERDKLDTKKGVFLKHKDEGYDNLLYSYIRIRSPIKIKIYNNRNNAAPVKS